MGCLFSLKVVFHSFGSDAVLCSPHVACAHAAPAVSQSLHVLCLCVYVYMITCPAASAALSMAASGTGTAGARTPTAPEMSALFAELAAAEESPTAAAEHRAALEVWYRSRIYY